MTSRPTLQNRAVWWWLAALLLTLILACALSVLRLGRFLVKDDPLTEADGIVALGGGGVDRIAHAVALFEAGYAGHVVVSGGRLYTVGIACSSAQLSLEHAQDLGLPAEALVLAPEAQSTHDEAVNLRAIIEARGWTSLIVVTDPPHTRRAAHTFRALLPGITITVSAAPAPDYDAIRWWSNEQSFMAVVNEVVKLLYYWVKHGIAPVHI